VVEACRVVGFSQGEELSSSTVLCCMCCWYLVETWVVAKVYGLVESAWASVWDQGLENGSGGFGVWMEYGMFEKRYILNGAECAKAADSSRAVLLGNDSGVAERQCWDGLERDPSSKLHSRITPSLSTPSRPQPPSPVQPPASLSPSSPPRP